jgi:hypothetical protein
MRGTKSLKMAGIALVMAALVIPFNSLMPSPAYAATGQSFYYIEPAVNVTPGTAGSWQDVDVSGYLPAGATGVILHYDMTGAGADQAIGFRKNGSADNRIQYNEVEIHTWAMIGVDGSRIFEVYVGSTAVDVWLAGYATDGVTFFDNSHDKTLTASATWQDIDISGDTGSDTAIGVILEVSQGLTATTWGVRKNGSSDARTGAYARLHKWAVIGVDGSEIFEGYASDYTDITFHVIGYVTSGAYFFTNGVDKTPGAGSWTDTDITADTVGSDIANGVFIEVYHTASGQQYGLRQNGSAESIIGQPKRHAWGILGVDSGEVFEAYLDLVGPSMHLIGYSIQNSPPSVDAAGIYETDHATPVTSLSPQTEYAVKVTVTDADTLENLDTVKVTVFYDTDSDDDSADVPGSGDTQKAAILTCTVGASPSWQIDPSASTTWVLESGNCVQPNLTGTSGDFWFHFRPGKVATEATDWDVYAVADDGEGTPGTLYDSSGYDMNWYGEVSIDTLSVTWDPAAPGTDFGETTKQTGISVTYVCNGGYYEKISAGSTWTSGSGNADLNAGGNPGALEISVKAWVTDNLTNAVLVPVYTTYTTIDDTGTQTGEAGDTEATNTLWLKLGTPLYADTFSGTIYYMITDTP